MFKRYLLIFITLTLTACGDSSEEIPPQAEPTPVPQPKPDPPSSLPTNNESARFLNMATFGANIASIENVSNTGFEAWLDEQIALPSSSHVAYLQALEPTLNLAEDETLHRRERLEAWFTHAITAEDQRKRSMN